MERVAAGLRERPDLLVGVAKFLLKDGLFDEDLFEVAEAACVAAFGERVPCACGYGVFPGFLCWGCGEWTAPEEKP